MAGEGFGYGFSKGILAHTMPFIIDACNGQGKRILNIKEFGAQLLSMDSIDDHSWINDFGCVTESRTDLLMAVQTSAQHFRFMPGPEFSPRLYRGETEFHEVCVPSICRGLCDNEAIYWTAKQIELFALLKQHPATHDLANSRIGGLTFGFTIEAIAQHYGYKTLLMDFSRSKDVAMFFATCCYDGDRRRYRPLCSGRAVLYTVDVGKLIKHRKGIAGLIPLGFEPLPRPEAQRALAVRMMPGENLNDMDWVSKEFIEITPALSARYFELFDGGRVLFPQNPFDDLINERRSNDILPLASLRLGLANSRLPQHPKGLDGAVEELVKTGFDVEEQSVVVNREIINAAAEDWQRKRSAYASRIRVRCVADHYVGS
jgi:hypothetical protein